MSKSRTLGGTNTVYVHTDAGPVAYKPGDEVPAEHAELITNQSVWDDPSEEEPDPRAMLLRNDGVPLTPEVIEALGEGAPQQEDAGLEPSPTQEAAGITPDVVPNAAEDPDAAEEPDAVEDPDGTQDAGTEDPPPARRGGRRG
jgi:hypothetical protein